jgi:hypothetical protein
MIIVKDRGNRIQIVHRGRTYNIHAGGRRGIQGPQGNPATNLVTSVNGLQGVVLLDATDVGADPTGSASTAETNANNYTDSEIAAINFPVDSVAGKTGTVVLDKTDVGLGNVDNTSDANKPISTATQTALNTKEDVANKSTTTTLGTSNTLYPTQNAVKTYVDTAITNDDTHVLVAGDTMTGNLAFDTDKGIRLTSGTSTSTATGLIQLKSDDEDSKAIIEFYDRDDEVTHWIQAHDYLVWYGLGNTVTAVNTGSNTLSAPIVGDVTQLPTGWRVQLTTTGTLPAPLAAATNYYVRAVTTNNFSFHPTTADATNNTNIIDITTSGTGTHTIVPDNDYDGNRHHHMSIVVDISVNQANLLIRRNTGETNGNIEFTGGGGGGNIKHDNNLDLYPQVLADGSKAVRLSLDVGSTPTLSSIGADVLNVDDKLVVTQKLTVGETTAQSSNLHVKGDGSAASGYFEASAESTASTGILRVVSPTTSKRAFDYRLSGDSVPRLKFDASAGSGSGTITFGNGTLQDTNLYRGAANQLKTDDVMFVSSLMTSITTKTTTYTASYLDSTILGDATSASFVVTLPTAVGFAGNIFTIKKIDATVNTVTIATTSSQTIDGTTTKVISAQWTAVTVQSDGANWVII